MSSSGSYSLPVAVSGVTLICLLQIFAMQGCVFGGRSASTAVSAEESSVADGAVAVDAYLFDVKFKQNGKRRSVRLDVYFADTIALFTARGYLGKGVAKGVWRPDSSLFYFPTENEYFSGPLDELTRAGCAGGGDLQGLVPALLSGRLLFTLESDSPVKIAERADREIQATATLGDCEAPVRLVFDYQGESTSFGKLFYLKEFSYDPPDGSGRVAGKRRILKRHKGLKIRKFSLNIPSNASAVQW